MTENPFIDSFRVEIPAMQINDVDDLFARGATLKPSKDFLERILSSKKIQLDASIKCLQSYAFNISIKNEQDIELAEFTP